MLTKEDKFNVAVIESLDAIANYMYAKATEIKGDEDITTEYKDGVFTVYSSLLQSYKKLRQDAKDKMKHLPAKIEITEVNYPIKDRAADSIMIHNQLGEMAASGNVTGNIGEQALRGIKWAEEDMKSYFFTAVHKALDMLAKVGDDDE